MKIHRSGELRELRGYSVLLYGTNGSGKTHFSSTWPKPLFIVPVIGLNELKTIEDYDLPYVTFNSIDDLKGKVKELGGMLQKDPDLFKTLVFDSLTTTQTMFETELKERSRVDKMEWEDWGKFTTTFVGLLTSLHSWPVHKIWITHTSDTEKIYALKGDSRQLFPGNCDLILYSECRDVQGVTQFRVHPNRSGPWPARVRRSVGPDTVRIPIMGPDPSPCYDLLAPHLGLRSLAEEEPIE